MALRLSVLCAVYAVGVHGAATPDARRHHHIHGSTEGRHRRMQAIEAELGELGGAEGFTPGTTALERDEAFERRISALERKSNEALEARLGALESQMQKHTEAVSAKITEMKQEMATREDEIMAAAEERIAQSGALERRRDGLSDIVKRKVARSLAGFMEGMRVMAGEGIAVALDVVGKALEFLAKLKPAADPNDSSNTDTPLPMITGILKSIEASTKGVEQSIGCSFRSKAKDGEDYRGPASSLLDMLFPLLKRAEMAAQEVIVRGERMPPTFAKAEEGLDGVVRMISSVESDMVYTSFDGIKDNLFKSVTGEVTEQGKSDAYDKMTIAQRNHMSMMLEYRIGLLDSQGSDIVYFNEAGYTLTQLGVEAVDMTNFETELKAALGDTPVIRQGVLGNMTKAFQKLLGYLDNPICHGIRDGGILTAEGQEALPLDDKGFFASATLPWIGFNKTKGYETFVKKFTYKQKGGGGGDMTCSRQTTDGAFNECKAPAPQLCCKCVKTAAAVQKLNNCGKLNSNTTSCHTNNAAQALAMLQRVNTFKAEVFDVISGGKVAGVIAFIEQMKALADKASAKRYASTTERLIAGVSATPASTSTGLGALAGGLERGSLLELASTKGGVTGDTTTDEELDALEGALERTVAAVPMSLERTVAPVPMSLERERKVSVYSVLPNSLIAQGFGALEGVSSTLEDVFRGALTGAEEAVPGVVDFLGESVLGRDAAVSRLKQLVKGYFTREAYYLSGTASAPKPADKDYKVYIDTLNKTYPLRQVRDAKRQVIKTPTEVGSEALDHLKAFIGDELDEFNAGQSHANKKKNNVTLGNVMQKVTDYIQPLIDACVAAGVDAAAALNASEQDPQCPAAGPGAFEAMSHNETLKAMMNMATSAEQAILSISTDESLSTPVRKLMEIADGLEKTDGTFDMVKEKLEGLGNDLGAVQNATANPAATCTMLMRAMYAEDSIENDFQKTLKAFDELFKKKPSTTYVPSRDNDKKYYKDKMFRAYDPVTDGAIPTDFLAAKLMNNEPIFPVYGYVEEYDKDGMEMPGKFVTNKMGPKLASDRKTAKYCCLVKTTTATTMNAKGKAITKESAPKFSKFIDTTKLIGADLIDSTVTAAATDTTWPVAQPDMQLFFKDCEKG